MSDKHDIDLLMEAYATVRPSVVSPNVRTNTNSQFDAKVAKILRLKDLTTLRQKYKLISTTMENLRTNTGYNPQYMLEFGTPLDARKFVADLQKTRALKGKVMGVQYGNTKDVTLREI
jgi:hypothetical protein